MTDRVTSEASPQRCLLLMVLPLMVFLALAALFWFSRWPLCFGSGLAMAIPRGFPQR